MSSKYNKALVALATGLFGLAAAFGLDVSIQAQQAILGLVPFIGTVLVYVVPNSAE